MSERKNPGRDSSGRFQKGHAVKSPGNPHMKRWSEYREAIRKAVTPAAMKRVLGRLVQSASTGDVQAARVILEYAIGKPDRASDLAPIQIDLPELKSPADLVEANSRIALALADGNLTPQQSTALSAAISNAAKAVELQQLADRVEEIERMVTEQLERSNR